MVTTIKYYAFIDIHLIFHHRINFCTITHFNTKYNFRNFVITHCTTDFACVTHKKIKASKLVLLLRLMLSFYEKKVVCLHIRIEPSLRLEILIFSWWM